MKKLNAGFTLIELLIYTALIAIFITGAITFALNVIQGRQKAKTQILVVQEARSTLDRIAYEIKRATSINVLAAGKLVLNTTGLVTTIELVAGEVLLTSNGVGPLPLTSNRVSAAGLVFTNNTSLNNDSKNITVLLDMQQAKVNVGQTYKAQTTLSKSIELNPAFNSARNLLIDSTLLNLDPNSERVQDIYLENTGTASLTIDKITATWTNAELIRRIKIAGNKVWDRNGPGFPAGMQSSGTVLDIVDTVVPSATGLLMDEVRFDGPVNGTNLDLVFTMLDGSTRALSIANLGTTGGGGGGGGGGGTEASSLVVNTASVSLKPNKNKEVLGITIANSSAIDITIASLTLTWANGRLVERVQVDGTRIWDRKGPGTPTGRQPSGTVLDVVDLVVPAGGGVLPINKIKFNGSMVGDTLNITFTMLDGSTLPITGIVL